MVILNNMFLNEKPLVVYIIHDDALEDAYNYDNIDEFKELVEDNTYLDYDVVSFDCVELAYTYLEGVFHGCDERAPCGKIALKSWLDEDKPYIEIIQNI